MPFKDVAIQCVNGVDITDWPETAAITSIDFLPNDFIIRHNKENGPGRWPDVHIPGWGNGADDPGNIQWTLWVVISVNGRWLTTGCLEFWNGRNNVHGPFSNAAKDWYYQAGDMAGRQPQAGERVGFIVTAGDHRLKDISIVRERSKVAWITVPANDTGTFLFQIEPEPKPEPEPQPEPPPPPPPPPPPDPQPQPPPQPTPVPKELMIVLLQLLEVMERFDKRIKNLQDIVAKADDLRDLIKQATAIAKLFGGK